MKWMQISVTASVDAADAVAAVLQDYGNQGISIEHLGIMPEMYDDGAVPPPDVLIVRAYLPADDRTPAALQSLESALHAQRFPAPHYALVDEEDWAEAWKAHYHTTRIGRRIVIRPIWEQAETQPGDVVIDLDPGMAFGTGTHATTQLCLAALEDVIRPGVTVLDMGTGSGILAIAAVKLGAVKVIAVDNDPIAVEVAEANARANGVGHAINAIEGSLKTVITSARRYDVLVANIIARIIIEMCGGGLGQMVRPGGHAIFSGIVSHQVEDVNAALAEAGLTVTGMREDGDWVAIEAVRPGVADD